MAQRHRSATQRQSPPTAETLTNHQTGRPATRQMGYHSSREEGAKEVKIGVAKDATFRNGIDVLRSPTATLKNGGFPRRCMQRRACNGMQRCTPPPYSSPLTKSALV